MPKGVVWRMEDVLMTLGGGIDAVTGEKYPTPEAFADKCLQDQTIALALAPFMHGGAQWQSFNSFFSGWKLIINDQVSFDADHVWEVVAKEKVMNLTIMGDAMGRSSHCITHNGKIHDFFFSNNLPNVVSIKRDLIVDD